MKIEFLFKFYLFVQFCKNFQQKWKVPVTGACKLSAVMSWLRITFIAVRLKRIKLYLLSQYEVSQSLAPAYKHS